MQAVMAFENAPPFAAPLRFFLTAPLFAVLAGVLIAYEGSALFASRWTPGALAATHLITVGFMLQVMLGALIQILPVVTGANLRRPLALARIVHGGLSAGALLLASGLYSGRPELLSGAALALGLTVLLFLASTVQALSDVPSTSPTIRGLKLALFGLLGVVGLGILMALALANGWALPLPALTDLHAGWGLGGWARRFACRDGLCRGADVPADAWLSGATELVVSGCHAGYAAAVECGCFGRSALAGTDQPVCCRCRRHRLCRIDLAFASQTAPGAGRCHLSLLADWLGGQRACPADAGHCRLVTSCG